MEHLSAITFATRQALYANGVSLTTGHTQQLIAAAFGHNNLASYQSSGEDDLLPEASELALDMELVMTRAAELGCAFSACVDALKAALAGLFPAVKIYTGHAALVEAWHWRFEASICNDERVIGETTMTNGTFPQVDGLQLPWWEGFEVFDGDDLITEFDGLVVVDQDDDRVFYGDKVDVRAQLMVERFGRRLFGQCSVDVEWAQLRWLGEPNNSPPF